MHSQRQSRSGSGWLTGVVKRDELLSKSALPVKHRSVFQEEIKSKMILAGRVCYLAVPHLLSPSFQSKNKKIVIY